MAFYPIQQGNTTTPLRFLLVLASDHITGATGKTPTVTIAKNDGLGFATPAGAVAELGNGWYQVAATASDASVLGPLTLHATATGCDPADEEYVVVNYSPTVVSVQPSPSVATVSVADLITAAFRRINVLQAGEVPEANDLADAFVRFNDLVNSLALDRLLTYQLVRTTFTLTSSKGYPGSPYTVGPGGDVNIARPVLPESLELRYQDTSISPTLERGMTKLTREGWEAILQKTLTSPLPSAWYYEPTYPTGSLYLWPVPTSTTLQGVFYVPTAVPSFGATSDLIALPPGYNRMLRDNLALELFPEWRENENADPLLVKAAEEAKRAVKLANVSMADLMIDPALTTRGRKIYNIFSDT